MGFIEDHRRLLPALKDAELFEHIGLNADAKERHAAISSIARATFAGQKNDTVRHYTLVCHCVSERFMGSGSTGHERMQEVVGYVYFKICFGTQAECLFRPVTRSSRSDGEKAEKLHGTSSGTHVVISHVKVGKDHQSCGVATLLLGGVLQVAQKIVSSRVEQPSALASAGLQEPTGGVEYMRLSVAEQNEAAQRLYVKLGFTIMPDEEPPHPGWLCMRLSIPGAASTLQRSPSQSPLRELRLQWLRLAWSNRRSSSRRPGASGAALTDLEAQQVFIRRLKVFENSLVVDLVEHETESDVERVGNADAPSSLAHRPLQIFPLLSGQEFP